MNKTVSLSNSSYIKIAGNVRNMEPISGLKLRGNVLKEKQGRCEEVRTQLESSLSVEISIACVDFLRLV